MRRKLVMFALGTEMMVASLGTAFAQEQTDTTTVPQNEPAAAQDSEMTPGSAQPVAELGQTEAQQTEAMQATDADASTISDQEASFIQEEWTTRDDSLNARVDNVPDDDEALAQKGDDQQDDDEEDEQQNAG
jgi:hypothetical protein